MDSNMIINAENSETWSLVHKHLRRKSATKEEECLSMKQQKKEITTTSDVTLENTNENNNKMKRKNTPRIIKSHHTFATMIKGEEEEYSTDEVSGYSSVSLKSYNINDLRSPINSDSDSELYSSPPKTPKKRSPRARSLSISRSDDSRTLTFNCRSLTLGLKKQVSFAEMHTCHTLDTWFHRQTTPSRGKYRKIKHRSHTKPNSQFKLDMNDIYSSTPKRLRRSVSFSTENNNTYIQTDPQCCNIL